jgi:hypothetical protein
MEIECSACKSPMQPLGRLPIRVGGTSGSWLFFLGKYAELSEDVFPLDVFRCPHCKRVEFFDVDESLQPGI